MTYNHYGVHPTSYHDVPDNQFYENFLPSRWDACNNATRQELLQEAVNRSASLNNEQGSCRVTLSDQMNYNVLGGQRGDSIRLNADFFGQNGNKDYLQETYGAPSFKALETAFHEDRHAAQNQIASGVIPADDPAQKAAFANNRIERVDIPINAQETVTGSTYLNASNSVNNGYSLYLAQPVEADARKVSEHRVSEIVKTQTEILQNKLSSDTLTAAERATLENDLRSLTDFTSKLEQRCFENQMKQASQDFGVKDLEKEVGNALSNMKNHTELPVDPNVSNSVQTMSIHSAAAQHLTEQPDLSSPSAAPSVQSASAAQDAPSGPAAAVPDNSALAPAPVADEAENNASAGSALTEADDNASVIDDNDCDIGL
ncbi:MAG: hypothetical protein IJE08_01320 [Clostridia bacterium]|nr:hypothetical protein [Clostridia bacterium]